VQGTQIKIETLESLRERSKIGTKTETVNRVKGACTWLGVPFFNPANHTKNFNFTLPTGSVTVELCHKALP